MLAGLSAEQRAHTVRALEACVAFALVSTLITIVYKVLLSSFHFDAKYLLLGTQQAVCLAVVLALRRGGGGTSGLGVPPAYDHAAFMRFRAAGVMFILNVVIGWYGLAVVNLPLFLCVRRTTVAFALAAEWLVLGSVQGGRVTASVALIVLGAVIAGAGTFAVDAVGIAYTVGNNVATALQLTLVKSASDATGVRGLGIVYYNALWALPLCAVGATVTGEWRYAAAHPALLDARFWAALLAASSMGGLMTYTTILATTLAGPLATTVTGNVKDVVATVLGAAAFGDYSPTPASVGGILVSFVGAGWFSAEKLREARQTSGAATAGTKGGVAGGVGSGVGSEGGGAAAPALAEDGSGDGSKAGSGDDDGPAATLVGAPPGSSTSVAPPLSGAGAGPRRPTGAGGGGGGGGAPMVHPTGSGGTAAQRPAARAGP